MTTIGESTRVNINIKTLLILITGVLGIYRFYLWDQKERYKEFESMLDEKLDKAIYQVEKKNIQEDIQGLNNNVVLTSEKIDKIYMLLLKGE